MATAGEVKVVFAADTAQYSAAIQKVRAQTAEFQATSTKAAHATIQPWQASSAAIRVLEGNIANNIRAAERFVASIGPLRDALVSAFPVIGGIALLGVFARLGEELAKTIEQARRVPHELQQGFASMANTALTANDELRKSNDELQNQIDKLEGRPQNNLAIALDDARLAADKLSRSLQSDNDQMESLMKRSRVGGLLGGLFSGQYRTGASEDKINEFNQRLQDQAHAYNMAVHEFGPDSAQAKAAQVQIDAVRSEAQRWVTARIAEVHTWKDVKGTTANLDMLQGFQTQLNYQQDRESLTADNERLTKQQQQLQHAHDLQEFQKKQLAEATKLSNEIAAQRRAYDEQVAAFGRTPGQIAPIPLLNVKGQPGKPATGLPMQAEDLSKQDTERIREASRAITEWLKEADQIGPINQRNADAIAEASLQMEIATGRMSRLDAAQAMAALHTQEFTDAMRALDAAQQATDELFERGDISKAEKDAALQKIENQRNQIRGEYGVTQIQDAAAQRSATALATFGDELARATVRLEDWSAKGAQLFEQTLASVNDEIVHALTTRDHQKGREFSNIGADFGRGIMGIGLEKLEGEVMKALGFGGKPDGSGSKPFHVIVDKAAAIGQAAGGAIGKIAGWLHIPGFAEGGALSSNMPAIVGERGPELFIPSTSGHIVPNHQLMGGGDTHIHVDARGATDPAQVEAAVHRAINQRTPQIVGMAVAATQDTRFRKPSTVR